MAQLKLRSYAQILCLLHLHFEKCAIFDICNSWQAQSSRGCAILELGRGWTLWMELCSAELEQDYLKWNTVYYRCFENNDSDSDSGLPHSDS